MAAHPTPVFMPYCLPSLYMLRFIPRVLAELPRERLTKTTRLARGLRAHKDASGDEKTWAIAKRRFLINTSRAQIQY